MADPAVLDVEKVAFARRTLVVDGLSVAVFERGAGEPCVLLHGYPQTHRCWRHIAPILSTTHRVIAPDWLGWGESERSLVDRPDYDREVSRIGLLLDALVLERVNLVCHDYGGFLGLGFAERFPQRVARLAIINSRAQGTFAPVGWLLFNAFALTARMPGGRGLLARMPLHAMHTLFMKRYVANGSFTDAELAEDLAFMTTYAGRYWLANFFRHFHATRRRELREGCRHLSMPAAVIWGDKDTYSPIAIGEELAALVPEATLTQIAGADHYVSEERPAEVAAALKALLARGVEGAESKDGDASSLNRPDASLTT
jgi:pimeloyl-ACP methyl ester carboxylesterase